jgi:hypothetical protein
MVWAKSIGMHSLRVIVAMYTVSFRPAMDCTAGYWCAQATPDNYLKTVRI